MMTRLTVLTFLALMLTVAAVEADFADYRALIRNVTPETFENTLSLSSHYPYSLTILNKTHPVLWEATGVKDLHLSAGEPDVILQDGIAYLAGNACGGIVSPNGGEMAFSKNNTLIISTPEQHSLYSISDCAQYNYIPRYGDMLAIADSYLCEATPAERIVRDLNSGTVIYSDTAQSHTIATYGDSNGCYFIQRDGTVDKFASNELSSFAYIDERVFSATAHDGGFAGFSTLGYFVVNISEVGGVDVEYRDVPARYCTDADNSVEPICVEEDFIDDLALSQKRAVTDDTLYVLTDERLRAYGREKSWEKQILMSYELPAPCVDGDNLYFNDLFGEIWRVNIYDGETLYKEADYPEYCDSGAVSYQNGAMIMNGYDVYRFAEPVRTEGGRTVYKRVEAENRVVYFVN